MPICNVCGRYRDTTVRGRLYDGANLIICARCVDAFNKLLKKQHIPQKVELENGEVWESPSDES